MLSFISDQEMMLSNLGIGITLLLGFTAIISPKKIANFVSLKPASAEGYPEIRATYGGFFIGIALVAVITQDELAYFSVAAGWLLAALVRLVTVFNGVRTMKNIGGVIFEGGIGALCLTGSLV